MMKLFSLILAMAFSVGAMAQTKATHAPILIFGHGEPSPVFMTVIKESYIIGGNEKTRFDGPVGLYFGGETPEGFKVGCRISPAVAERAGMDLMNLGRAVVQGEAQLICYLKKDSDQAHQFNLGLLKSKFFKYN